MQLPRTLGAAEAAAWISARGLDVTRSPHWFVEISLGSEPAEATLELNLYPEEWGFVVRHDGRVSSVRITDQPFIHGVDELRLLAQTPKLELFPAFLGRLETLLNTRFLTHSPNVRTNLARGATALRPWLGRD